MLKNARDFGKLFKAIKERTDNFAKNMNIDGYEA